MARIDAPLHTATPSSARRGRVRVLAAALALTMSAVLPAMLTGTMAERMREAMGMGETTLGLSLALFFTTSAMLSSRGGRLADRIGWQRAGRLAVGASILSLVGIAVLARDPWVLGLFLCVGGAAMSVAVPTGSLMIARELPQHRQGLLFGVKQTSIPLAGLFAGLAVPVVALTLGWRWSFALAVGVPLVALVLLAGRRPGPNPGANPDADRGADSGVAARDRPAATGPDDEPAPLPAAFGVLSLGGGLATVAISAMAAFLVVAAVDAGIGEGRAGILVAVVSVLGLTVRVTGGWLADRHGSVGFRPVAVMLAVGTVGFGLLAVHMPLAVVAGAVVAYAAGWGWPGLFYFGAATYGPHAPAAATGRIQVGLAGGAAIGPLLFGVVAETQGFPVAWGGAAVLMVVASALVAVGTHRLGDPPGPGNLGTT